MVKTTTSALDGFAAEFIRDIGHYKDVRSEDLAEAFREYFELPPFPTIDDLRGVCGDLGIPLWRLPKGQADMEGMNFSTAEETAILVRRGMVPGRMETTIAHEIREVLENAFRRVKPSYEGRRTHDNGKMNPASDRFGGYLLMQTTASDELMAELGYDLSSFAFRTGRSLPSVIRRAQHLYSAKSKLPAPVTGVWLFEADWDAVTSREVKADDLVLTTTAKLSGFSMSKGTSAREVFPLGDTDASAFMLTSQAVEGRTSLAANICEVAATPNRDFRAIAEPILARGNVWKVLLSAVRRDGMGEIGPWLERVEARLLPDQIRSV